MVWAVPSLCGPLLARALPCAVARAHALQQTTCAEFRGARFMECLVRSFRLNIRCLNDRPPFLDLGLVEGGEALRGLLLARGDVQAKLTKTSAHARIGECLHHRAVEFDDDVARCPLGRK